MRTFFLLILWGDAQSFALHRSVRRRLNSHAVTVDSVSRKDITDSETDVTVVLSEIIDETTQKVTSFDLTVSLPGTNRSFICSHLVAKKLPAVEQEFEEGTNGEWQIVPQQKDDDDESSIYVSNELGQMQKSMACRGMIEVRSLTDGSNISLFENSRVDSESDITVLSMMIHDGDTLHSTELVFSDDDGTRRFYLTGKSEGNDAMFGEKSMRNEAVTRRLDYYKFRCRKNKRMLTIQIGIVADSYFCTKQAGRGTCKSAANAIVNMGSMITEEQLNVRLKMDAFFKVKWRCDTSKSFDSTLKKMRSTNFAEPKRALYHFFTTCMPACWYTGCRLTAGLAYNPGMNSSTGSNVGVNRFPNRDSLTFIHEMGHSIGFGHFFSTYNRDSDDGKKNTSYGIMDYTDNTLRDPRGPRRYNGVVQFSPRHEDNVYGSKSYNDPCRQINHVDKNITDYPTFFRNKFYIAKPRTRSRRRNRRGRYLFQVTRGSTQVR